MKNQREAEREEQRRIKSHILNLDFQDLNTDAAGTADKLLFDPFSSPNPNLSGNRSRSPLVPQEVNRDAYNHVSQGLGATEKHPNNPTLGRPASNNATKSVDRPGSNRRGDRARKLQLSDVDWYALDD